MDYQPISAKIRLRRIPYYIRSFFTLFRALEPHSRVRFIGDLLLLSGDKTIYLQNGLVFELKSLLDILTLKEVIMDDEYQKKGVQITHEDRIIVDIGAGFGDFSIMIAKKFPKAKIYAFEPDPIYFKLLNVNISRNKIKNVFPHKLRINSLRQIFALLSSSKCDFMKMDCEGCEFSIINRKNKGDLQRVKKLVMEYHEDMNRKIDKLNSLMTEAKFKTVIFPREQVTNIGLLSAQKYE